MVLHLHALLKVNFLTFQPKHYYAVAPITHVPTDTVKPVLSGHSKRRPKIGFQDRLSLNACQKYCRMLQESILQYFRPSLSYHLSVKIFVLSIFEWALKTGFTVDKKNNHNFSHKKSVYLDPLYKFFWISINLLTPDKRVYICNIPLIFCQYICCRYTKEPSH